MKSTIAPGGRGQAAARMQDGDRLGGNWQLRPWFETVDDTCYAAFGPSLAFDSAGLPAISYYDSIEKALKLARLRRHKIFRGGSISSLEEVATAVLPWTDPDPVLPPPYTSPLFYQVENLPSIVLKKEGQSITICSF